MTLEKDMNYLIAWCLCIAGTILTALGDGDNVKWLAISDANVTIWLLVAWALDKKSTVTVLTVG